jgi:hypothetical protein
VHSNAEKGLFLDMKMNKVKYLLVSVTQASKLLLFRMVRMFSWQKNPLAGGSYAVDRGSENSLEWKIFDESEL